MSALMGWRTATLLVRAVRRVASDDARDAGMRWRITGRETVVYDLIQRIMGQSPKIFARFLPFFFLRHERLHSESGEEEEQEMQSILPASSFDVRTRDRDCKADK
ncbi:MAG TPA: hypothetical protein VMA37_12925 [Acetobacteraceae bacterium]|nr:hypothetical protein [Acetobacteraceae bacterium]